MSLLPEILQIRRAFLRIFGLFVLLFIMCFAVSFSGFRIGEWDTPALSGGTVTVWAIQKIQTDLVPDGSSLISLSPLDPFFAESAVAAMFAFLLTLPLIAYEFWSFAAPALHTHEKRGLVGFFLGMLVMMGVGAVFSYRMLLPFIMQGLYALNPTEVIPLYGLRAVVSLVTGTIMATALIFLLPLVMILLSKIGLVPSAFWRTYARHALLVSLIVSAIITPDGSGMSMIVLALPISALYGLGELGSRLYGRSEVFMSSSNVT